MKLNKKHISLIFCIALTSFLIQSHLLHAEVVDRIVAIVNDDIITYSELNKEGQALFKRITAEAPLWQVEPSLKKAREETLERLIDKLILQQRAKEYGVSVSDEELDAAINNIMASNNVNIDEFKAEIERAGHSFEGYKETIRTQIIQSKLVSIEVRSKVVITEEKVNEYYNQHYVKKSDHDGYHILQIGFVWGETASSSTKEEAKSKAELVRKRIVNGEDFTELAKMSSELPSATDGGDIGVFSEEELATYMRDVIITMRPGDISPVVETPVGYQFFKLLSVKKGDLIVQEPYENVKEKIKEQLYEEELKTHFEKWVTKLREEAYIKKTL